ncbi:tail fiber domain-containing protein [Sphingobium sp. HWE2-09]|uniref:tail fiber domain-containing protein n=1 Tax=Sphingobium sp. HWE2-09 TaxID=3108390 RepID=UPI002DD327C1|nr:tail fiber domain-containing protein [Sphingobium sp. HWE2-09]
MAITMWEMADLVREVCFEAGDGPLALGGPMPGYRGFAATLSAGARFPYVIQGVTEAAQWEAGTGTIDEAGRLVRTPHASSAGGAAVDFAAGEKHVGLALHADWVARVEGHGHDVAAIDGLAAALAGRQAASSDLSAIAALATTGFGRGTLTLGDAAAFRSYIGAGTSSASGTVTAVAAGAGMDFAAIGGAGSVVMGTPSSVTLASANGVASGTHSHAFAPGGSSAQYLRGDGSLATFPTGGALSRVNDANVTLTLGGGATNALLNPASITVGWSGLLAVPRGGTGAASLTGYVKGNGAAAMSASTTIPASDISGLGTMAAQNAGAVAISGGSATLGSFSLSPASGAASAAISAANGQSASLSLGTAGVEMWRFERTATANSGGNAGSDLALRRMDDSGALLGTAMSVSRSTGTVSVNALSSPTIISNSTIATPIAAYRTSSANNCGYVAQTTAGSIYFGNADGSKFAVGPSNNLATNPYLSASATMCTIGATVETTFAGPGRPLTDNAIGWGSAAFRWATIYAGSGTINTSDARAKCDVGAVDDALIEAWGDVGWQRYRFVEAVAEKGDAARWHIGLVAQQVRDAIDARQGEGAAVRWGLICHDRWDAAPEERAEDGTLVRAARAAGDRWGLRYDECFALEALWQRRAIAAMAARLDALDAGGGDAGG